MIRSLLAAGVLLALAGPAAAEPIPTASRVLKLCQIEDPTCLDEIRASYARVAPSRGRCPRGKSLPDEVLFQLFAQTAPLMVRLSYGTGYSLTIDQVQGDAISTVAPQYCQ